MDMIKAIIAICFIGTAQCPYKLDVRVEPAGCNQRSYHAQIPMDGRWQNVTTSIKCRK